MNLFSNKPTAKPPASLGDALPYLEMDQDKSILWLKDGSASFTFEVIPKNPLSFTEPDLESLRSGLTAIVDQVPEATTLQFWLSRRQARQATDQAYQNWKALRVKKTPTLVTAQEALERAKEDLLDQAWKSHALYQTRVFVTVRVPRERVAKRAMKMGALSYLRMLKASPKDAAKSHAVIEEELLALIKAVRTQLQSQGFQVYDFDHHLRWKFLYEFFNPERELVPDLEDQTATLSLCDQLTKTDLVEDRNGLALGRTRLRVGSLKTYPESSIPAILAGLAGEPHEFDLIYTLLSLDQVRERDRMSRRQRLASGMASGNQVRDITAETQLDDIEETLQAMGGGERLCAASLHLLCREATDRIVSFDRLLHAGESLGTGSQWFEETVAALPVFFSILPFAPTHLTRPKRILASNLSDFLPVYGIGPGHKEACVLFETLYQSNLGFSLFEDSPSANAILIGSTGSGKSTLACGLILGMTMGAPENAPSSFVIDVGNSFKRSILYLGGASLDLSPEQGTVLNPFDLEPGQQRPDPEKIKFLTALFDEILGDGGTLGKLERALIETEILLFYDQDIPHTLSTFRDHLEASSSPELRRLAKLLALWCKPHPYGLLLDGTTNVSFATSHLHFELKGCQRYPDLLRVVMLVVMDMIWREVKKRNPKRSLVVIDEAHTIIRPSGDGRANSSARWVEDCFRQMRKFSSAAIAISQTAKDLKTLEIGDGILANSPNRFILKQRGDEATLKNDLKLNEQELQDVFSLSQLRGEYSEFFLQSETIRGILRYRPTPHELWLSTTHPPDQALLTKVMAEHPSWTLPELIEYVAKHYPWGSEAGEVAS